MLYIIIDCSGFFYLRKYALKNHKKSQKKKQKQKSKCILSITLYVWLYRVFLFKEICLKSYKNSK